MIPIKALEKAIRLKRGNVAAVARGFDVSRTTVYERIKKSVKLQKALKEARETMLDNAETELYDQALDGNTAALLFFLKTQGKKRGYVERHEHSGPDGEMLVITRIVENRNDVAADD